MWLAVDDNHVDAVQGHRDEVRLSAVKQRAAYAVDLNRRIGNNPASDVRNAPAQRPRQQSSTRRPQRGRAFSVAIRNKPTCVWKKNPTGLLAGFSVVERRHSPRKNCRRAV